MEKQKFFPALDTNTRTASMLIVHGKFELYLGRKFIVIIFCNRFQKNRFFTYGLSQKNATYKTNLRMDTF
jgi:hypothetical protein